MYIQYYLEQLEYNKMPEFLIKYLQVPSLLRLKKVGYFCGMDKASKDIYNFKEYISRYDHSLSVALTIYKLTKDKIQTLSGLFHDVATPCFSHVIDYMNKDYAKQESTEEYTKKIMMNDKILKKCLDEDKININDIIDFKKYTIVDNDRPKVCADRIDGVILTGIGWTKDITKKDIKEIVNDLVIVKNEFNEDEIGFKSKNVADKVVAVSEKIDIFCHSNEDNYMMDLLAEITRLAIDKKYILYDELYTLNEEELWKILENKNNKKLQEMIHTLKTVKKKDISEKDIPNLKVRDLNPLVDMVRFKDM